MHFIGRGQRMVNSSSLFLSSAWTKHEGCIWAWFRIQDNSPNAVEDVYFDKK